MDRRTALRAALGAAIGACGTAYFPRSALAETPDPATAPPAGGLYYTRERPGRWSGKAAGHLPVVTRAGNVITIRTPHPQDGFKHYIVKHLVLDQQFKVVADTIFNPWRDDPVSTADVYKLEGLVYAVSVCNIHDAWLAPFRL